VIKVGAYYDYTLRALLHGGGGALRATLLKIVLGTIKRRRTADTPHTA
jgi:hypothetical protein